MNLFPLILSTAVSLSSPTNPNSLPPSYYQNIIKERVKEKLSQVCGSIGRGANIEYNPLNRRLHPCGIEGYKPLTTKSIEIGKCGTTSYIANSVCDIREQNSTKPLDICLLIKTNTGDILQVIHKSCDTVFQEVHEKVQEQK